MQTNACTYNTYELCCVLNYKQQLQSDESKRHNMVLTLDFIVRQFFLSNRKEVFGCALILTFIYVTRVPIFNLFWFAIISQYKVCLIVCTYLCKYIYNSAQRPSFWWVFICYFCSLYGCFMAQNAEAHVIFIQFLTLLN